MIKNYGWPGNAARLALMLVLATSATLMLSGPQALAQSGPQALTQQARAALATGKPKTAAKLFEKAANQCSAPAQLALVDIYRKGEGRKANGVLAFAWLISAQRATNNWSRKMVVDIDRMTNELPAYMSGKQRHGAYCRGLKLLAKSCGAGNVLRRIERLLACS